jgi:hypothetical protein
MMAQPQQQHPAAAAPHVDDSSVHKALLNILWSEQVLSDDALARYVAQLKAVAASGGAAPLPAAAAVAAVPQIQVDHIIEAINHDLKELGFEVQRGLSESDSAFYYVLCNTNPDELSRTASLFSPTELKFIKKLVRLAINVFYLALCSDPPSASVSLSLLHVSFIRSPLLFQVRGM